MLLRRARCSPKVLRGHPPVLFSSAQVTKKEKEIKKLGNDLKKRKEDLRAIADRERRELDEMQRVRREIVLGVLLCFFAIFLFFFFSRFVAFCISLMPSPRQALDAERREFDAYKEREMSSKSKKHKGKKSRD